MGIMTSDILDPSLHWPDSTYPLITNNIAIADRKGCTNNACDSS